MDDVGSVLVSSVVGARQLLEQLVARGGRARRSAYENDDFFDVRHCVCRGVECLPTRCHPAHVYAAVLCQWVLFCWHLRHRSDQCSVRAEWSELFNLCRVVRRGRLHFWFDWRRHSDWRR